MALSTPKEMTDAGHRLSVELIFGEDAVCELAFSMCDNPMSVKEGIIKDITDHATKCFTYVQSP